MHALEASCVFRLALPRHKHVFEPMHGGACGTCSCSGRYEERVSLLAPSMRRRGLRSRSLASYTSATLACHLASTQARPQISTRKHTLM